MPCYSHKKGEVMSYKRPPTRGARSHQTREQLVREAESKSILDVAQTLGMELERIGQDYTWKDHDSLVIRPNQNYFYWNAQGIGGNAIQLVKTILECNFRQAVDYLTNQDIKQANEIKIEKKPFVYKLREKKETPEMDNYLNEKRRIAPSTVQNFVAQGLLSEVNYKDRGASKYKPTLVFKSKSLDGQIKGIALQGINEERRLYPERGRLKKTMGDGHYGCLYTHGNPPSFGQATKENPLKIIAFEAPMDMMAYSEIFGNQIGDAYLLAMNGLKKRSISLLLANLAGSQASEDKKINFLDTIEKTVEPLEQVKIILAVDNDKAGHNFIDNFNISKIKVSTHLAKLEAGQDKADWNDKLIKLKNEQSQLEVNKEHSFPKIKIKEALKHINSKGSMSMNTENEQLNQAISDLNKANVLNEKQAQQIAELVNQFQKLERKHEEVLQKFELAQDNQPQIPTELKTDLQENRKEALSLKAKISQFVQGIIETAKMKSMSALKLSLTTLHIDSFLSQTAKQLSHFSEKLMHLEGNIKELSVEQPALEKEKSVPEVEVDKAQQEKPSIKIGAYQTTAQPSSLEEDEQAKATFNNASIETDKGVLEPLSQEVETKKVTPVLKALPEDFRPVLENTQVSISNEHPITDAQGRACYSYSVNETTTIQSLALEEVKGLNSSQISERLHKDFVERVMAGKLVIDDIFTEDAKNKMVSQYRNQRKVPNAFEKRMMKAEENKKTERTVENLEQTETSYRSR